MQLKFSNVRPAIAYILILVKESTTAAPVK